MNTLARICYSKTLHDRISKFLNRFGEGHADETVRKVNGCLSQCLKDAVYDGHIKKTQHIT